MGSRYDRLLFNGVKAPGTPVEVAAPVNVMALSPSGRPSGDVTPPSQAAAGMCIMGIYGIFPFYMCNINYYNVASIYTIHCLFITFYYIYFQDLAVGLSAQSKRRFFV